MRKILLIALLPFIISGAVAQSELGSFSGSFEMNNQYYMKDSIIGAGNVPEKLLSNGFFNLNYTNGAITAGIRYENYANALLGYDRRLAGSGIPYRFARYSGDMIDVTAGNFYEQFGSGMVFRTYEDRQLGFDNSIDGARVKLTPGAGLSITGLIGKMRNFWATSESLIRGVDANLDINSMLCEECRPSINYTVGASFVSKYEMDKNPQLKLPENVGAGSMRFGMSGESFTFNAEYAMKANDPSLTNQNSYNTGNGLLLQGAYFTEGLGINLNFHRIDNFDFRAERNATGTVLNLNYLPPITKQHPYSLTAMYPYNTQLNGEIGFQTEINYTFPKESFLGGKYPWQFSVNFSMLNSIDTTHTEQYLYDSKFGFGKKNYFQDASIYASKKFSSDVKANFGLVYQKYDRDIAEKDGAPTFGMVTLLTGVADVTFKVAKRQSLRAELQHMMYSQEMEAHEEYSNGNWASLLLEYTIAPNWFITVFDEYNYGNEFEAKRLHYYTLSTAYVHGGTRVQLSYGRQRSGILCVGGVCRLVPASNGFNLSISTSF